MNEHFFHAGTNDIPAIATFIAGFILIFGLCSFVIKEKAFLADSLVATIVGIMFGPRCLNVLDPSKWPGTVGETTLHFADLVINIQIMAAAISLPRQFWKSRWKSLLVLLGPVTIYMWLTTALVFRYVFLFGWFESLLLASCCAPTDPVLANSIVNGRFAELHINKRVRTLLSAESASNDGAVFPFFQLAIFLLRYPEAEAFGKWAYLTLIYSVAGAIILGLIIGYGARVSLRASEEYNWIDKRNFLVFELALALFTAGLATMLNMASFITVLVAGIAFSWDGWFAEETADAHVQEVIDMLVNVVFFIYFGSIIPWNLYGTESLPLYKLFIATALILVLRRLPAVLLLMRYMRPLLTLPEAIFVGWFGPVGVGALWYQTLASSFFPQYDLFSPIISFIVFCSVIVHGIMVPFVHLTIVGYKSRTLSRSIGNASTVPRWPTGLEMGSVQISGPSAMVRTADGRYIPADQIELRRPPSLLKEEGFGGDATTSDTVLFNLQEVEAVDDEDVSAVDESNVTLDGNVSKIRFLV